MPAACTDLADARAALDLVLRGFERLAVAVSGGVDSMTLAWAAHRAVGDAVMYHAVSPAVPPEATARVRAYAERAGWRLELVDAGELRDPAYLANPVDRCFFCKQDLYGTIRTRTDRPIASGTNLDDLGDFRPGLRAAAAHGVRHPFVEAGLDKAMVRRLAAAEGLVDLAELPAAPCLSSRIETGIPVTVGRLAFVLAVERELARRLGPGDQRCRVRAGGVVLEIAAPRLAALDGPDRRHLVETAQALAAAHGIAGPVTLAPYVRGSAFLHEGRARRGDGA